MCVGVISKFWNPQIFLRILAFYWYWGKANFIIELCSKLYWTMISSTFSYFVGSRKPDVCWGDKQNSPLKHLQIFSQYPCMLVILKIWSWKYVVSDIEQRYHPLTISFLFSRVSYFIHWAGSKGLQFVQDHWIQYIFVSNYFCCVYI